MCIYFFKNSKLGENLAYSALYTINKLLFKENLSKIVLNF